MKKQLPVGITGPLVEHLWGYERELSVCQYSLSAKKRHLHLMAHVSRWLVQNGVSCADFTQSEIDHFLSDRRADGYVRFRTLKGMTRLLNYLRAKGVIPEPVEVISVDLHSQLLERFAVYLSSERGLRIPTVLWYRRLASLFLGTCQSNNHIDDLNADDISRFVIAECSKRSVGSANNVVTALRALLRFLYLQGEIASPLADTVPSAAIWRDGGRSRAVSDCQVDSLLASCDRRSNIGRRDLAMLSLLSRLGLRAAEVASITLEDINWQSGEITVFGKGNRCDKLPLPMDVGQTLVDYCQKGRPKSNCRSLFLHVRAPYSSISPSNVSIAVLRASARAGITPIRAHQLRHRVASAMRRAGAPMFEIGQVLRHSHVTTTAIYAKDDLGALRSISRPWPGAQS